MLSQLTNKPRVNHLLAMAVISNFILHDNFFFQHYLILLGSNLATPGLLATIICAEGNIEVTSIMLGNMLFACGICTLIQTYFGTR